LRERLVLLLGLLAFFALTLAGCGSSSSEEGKVEEVIETAAASNDPADCRKLQSQEFAEQAWHESGDGAVTQCEEKTGGSGGVEAATVSGVKVNGSTATAEATLSGGTLDGQTVAVALAKADDQWKLNEIVEFTRFDESRLIEGLEGGLESNSAKVSTKFATCFVEAFDQGGKREIEELLLTPASEEVEGVAKRCA
jgi:hypothetical protein